MILKGCHVKQALSINHLKKGLIKQVSGFDTGMSGFNGGRIIPDQIILHPFLSSSFLSQRSKRVR